LEALKKKLMKERLILVDIRSKAQGIKDMCREGDA
jgi:hypothetical protein